MSIRELVRQGYLFGAHILIRPLAERTTILLYLRSFPEQIYLWTGGWNHRDAPSLAKMFEALQSTRDPADQVPGYKLTASMNSLIHSKPDSAQWNLIHLEKGGMAHAPSKILDRPDLCDELCENLIPWFAIIPAMMNFYFPDEAAI